MSERTDPNWDEVEESGPVQVDLDCDQCGAKMTWDPVPDALACDHCGHTRQVPRGEGTIEERPLEEAGSAARGLGVAVRVSRCENCGARVSFDASATATSCVFCGSASVLDQEANRNQIRPESLIPLDVGEARVEQAFRRWIGRLWFRPSALKRTRAFQAVGVYVPAWTFDADVSSEWSADAGHYYWVTQTYTTLVNGKPQMRTRQVRKIRWVPAWGDRRDVFDDLQVVASRGVEPKLVAKLGAFDTGELVPYRPEYLAGWRAEEYQIDLEEGWGLGKERITAIQRGRCSADVPGDTQRNLRVRNTIRDVRWKHVLLPLWSLTYAYRGRPYAVLIHGQNGKVVGDAPLSWVKIASAVAAVAAIVLAVVVVAGGR